MAGGAGQQDASAGPKDGARHLVLTWKPVHLRAGAVYPRARLLISLLERCDRDIVTISLFGVRHGIHRRTLSAQPLPRRTAVWQTKTNTILIKTSGPNDGSQRDNYKGRGRNNGGG